MIDDQNFYRFVIVTPTRITVCAGYLLAIHICSYVLLKVEHLRICIYKQYYRFYGQ